MPTVYEERTKAELLELAAERNVEGRSSMSKDDLIAALRGGEQVASEPKEKPQAKAEPKPKALPWVPPDPVHARNLDKGKIVETAVDAVDEALGSEEEAANHSAELLAARSLFQSLRYSEPFRWVLTAAYESGKRS